MAKVLILGATSAIATEVAVRCAARGDALFVVGRNPDKLAALVERLGSACVGHLAADLTETSHSAARVEAARVCLGGMDTVLIAHGLLGSQLQTETDWDAARAVLETNFLSVVSLLIPLANALEGQGHGQLAVISSVAGERGRPRNYTYGAAKGALTLYLQGLRSRLWGSGVAVHTIKLGPVHSPMTVGHPKNALFATPGDVATQILARLEGGGGASFLPWFWAPIMGIVRKLPEPWFQKFPFLSGR